MLLTLSAPAKSEYEFKTPHDFPLSFTSAPKRDPPPSYAAVKSQQSPRLAADRDSRPASAMSTPHRGLPPPAAMTLPDPQRTAGPPPNIPPLGQMPAPPPQWQGADESMRNWLAAKAEEDKRKQEEEKTRQEGLRLEQRKIESAMLRDSMAGGVPPHMVPIIFAGIGGASLANISTEWLQQYAGQLGSSQQQALAAAVPPQQVSPDVRRNSRLIAQAPYAPSPPAPPPGSVLHGQPAAPYSPTPGAASPQIGSRPPYQAAPTSAPRSSGYTALPRLTTNEMHIAQAPTLGSGPVQEPAASSPSIYFHHWVPPVSQSASGSGSGSATKNEPGTPTEFSTSPKKRKDQRAHERPPAPTSAPQGQTSPSFTQTSSATSTPGASAAARGGRHSRNRSDMSSARIPPSSGPGRSTPPPSGRSEGFDRQRARTTSDSAGSRTSDRP